MFGWIELGVFPFFAATALKSFALLGLACLTAFFARRWSAAVRHLLWTAAFASLLALPLLSLALPALRVPVDRVVLPLGATFRITGSVPAGEPAMQPERTPGGTTAPATGLPWRPGWRLSLIVLWALGAAASLVRMQRSLTAVRRIRRASKLVPVDDLTALAGTLGLRREVAVLETRSGSMPMTCGVFRPAVLIPAGAGWTRERLRHVLLHELAHVRRGDTVTHLLARAALCLHWWNPLAWIAWREFVKERERAADDLVLAAGAQAPDYAGHLLEVARSMQPIPVIASASVAMARPSQLEGRLLAILDSGRNRSAPRRSYVATAALLVVAVVTPLAALRAQEGAPPPLPADVDATVRAASSQRNYEMLDGAAQAAEALREYDIARKLRDTSIEIRAQLAGRQSVLYGAGLLNLAGLEHRRGRAADAEAFYTQAAAILGDRPEAAPALVRLGIAAAVRNELGQAMDFFQRAYLAGPAHAGVPAMWMAVVRQREEKLDEAEALYQRALAAQNPDSNDAATIMELHARLLRQQNREEEARSMQERAAALRKSLGARTESTRRQLAPASPVRRIGGNVKAPALVHKVEPQYTEEARLAKYEGTAVLYVEVGHDGVPRNLRILSEVGLGLTEKALDAIAQWKFQPGVKDGQPVTVAATVEVNFRLL